MRDVLERVGPAQIPRFFFSFCFFGLAGLVLWLSLSHVKRLLLCLAWCCFVYPKIPTATVEKTCSVTVVHEVLERKVSGSIRTLPGKLF